MTPEQRAQEQLDKVEAKLQSLSEEMRGLHQVREHLLYILGQEDSAAHANDRVSTKRKVLQYVKDNPGLPSSVIADSLTPLITTRSSRSTRHVIQTILSTLVKEGRLVKQGKLFHPNDQ